MSELKIYKAVVGGLNLDEDSGESDYGDYTDVVLKTDYDQLEKELQTEREKVDSLPNAIRVLVKDLTENEGYRMSWQANIAMAFKDESLRNAPDAPIHDIANNAAINFLKLLCMKEMES